MNANQIDPYATAQKQTNFALQNALAIVVHLDEVDVRELEGELGPRFACCKKAAQQLSEQLTELKILAEVRNIERKAAV